MRTTTAILNLRGKKMNKRYERKYTGRKTEMKNKKAMMKKTIMMIMMMMT